MNYVLKSNLFENKHYKVQIVNNILLDTDLCFNQFKTLFISDVNECLDVTKHSCDQICEDTDGSYQCKCHSGFVYTKGKCAGMYAYLYEFREIPDFTVPFNC